MSPLIQLKKDTPLFLVFALVCLTLSPRVQAVVPAPDGGYSGGNTAEGQTALLNLSTGGFNTAIGWLSLRSNTTNSFNTAIGAGTLLANAADDNTATGAGALLSNTTGDSNTANGALALFSNSTGAVDTATGAVALLNNTTGLANTATGAGALFSNTMGNNNTATGFSALSANFTGDGNTATGRYALTITTGSGNTALGANAGSALTSGNNNIDIGVDVVGVAGEANTIRIGNTNITTTFIRGISGATAAGGAAVFVNSNGQLGTMTSSARFKDEIKPMDKASDALFALKPVSFRYKKEIDPAGIPQFGLVAEEVERVSPDLVIRDAEGKPQTVRYEQVNAMLLNEFLKEHKNVQQLKSMLEKQDAIIAQQQKGFESKLSVQQKQIEALTSDLQKVSAGLDAR